MDSKYDPNIFDERESKYESNKQTPRDNININLNIHEHSNIKDEIQMIVEDPKEQFESKANIRNVSMVDNEHFSPKASQRDKMSDSLDRDNSMHKHNDSLAEYNLLQTNRNQDTAAKDTQNNNNVNLSPRVNQNS